MRPHDDPLVIKADIGHDVWVEKMIIDREIFADILYLDTFLFMGYKKEDLSPCKEVIYGFTSIDVPHLGVIDLRTSIGLKVGRVS